MRASLDHDVIAAVVVGTLFHLMTRWPNGLARIYWNCSRKPSVLLPNALG